MGLEVNHLEKEAAKMNAYDERTAARLYVCSDNRTVVSEGDIRARKLIARHGEVTRGEATILRAHYRGADIYLYPKDAEAPVIPDIARAKGDDTPEPEPREVFFGTDEPIDFGEFAGSTPRQLDDEYLRRMTYTILHSDWAKAEEERRGKGGKKGGKAVTAPAAKPKGKAPEVITLGPDDVLDFGVNRDKKVSEVPDSYLLVLKRQKKHQDWAVAEIDRRDIDQAWINDDGELTDVDGKVIVPAGTETPKDEDANVDEVPLDLGPDDVLDFGNHEDETVKDLPKEYLERLAQGESIAHKGWAQTELERRTAGG